MAKKNEGSYLYICVTNSEKDFSFDAQLLTDSTTAQVFVTEKTLVMCQFNQPMGMFVTRTRSFFFFLPTFYLVELSKL